MALPFSNSLASLHSSGPSGPASHPKTNSSAAPLRGGFFMSGAADMGSPAAGRAPPRRTPAPRPNPAPRGTSGRSPPGPSPSRGRASTRDPAPGRCRPLGVFYLFNGVGPIAAQLLHRPAEVLDLAGQKHGLVLCAIIMRTEYRNPPQRG